MWADVPVNSILRNLRRYITNNHLGKPAPEPVPAPTPVPATVPNSRWENPPWNGKHVYVAWGLSSGQFSVDQIANKAQQAGCRAVALEITPENDGFHVPLKVALHARGIAYIVWEASYQTSIDKTIASVCRYVPDAYLADIEEKFDAKTWVPQFDAVFPDLPRALCATGGGLETVDDAAPWIENWDCCMQDYVVHGTNMDEAHGENFAYWRSFPVNAAGFHHFPVIEVEAEGSPTLAAQAASVAPWKGAVGIYTIEYLTDQDWQALASL